MKGGVSLPARIPDRAAFQLRINRTLRDKLAVIAVRENRPMNSQIEYALQRHVEDYEREHGPVPICTSATKDSDS